MRKLLKLFYFILITQFMLSSCDNDLLEPTVYSSVTEQTFKFSEDDFNGAIGAVYFSFRGWWHHQHWYMAQELSADEIVMPANAGGWDDGGIYRNFHLHNWNSETLHLRNIWIAHYKGVFLANRCINQIENDLIPLPSGIDKDAILAEMKVVRAFYNWLLTDSFGDVPLVLTNDQDLPDKTDRKSIYEFVVEEITNSIPLLSEENNTSTYGRFNKWAAKALLANVYLNAEVYTGESRWEECLEQTNDIINSGKFSLENNYNGAFRIENTNSPEIIFAIPFDENFGTGFYIQRASWHAALVKKYNLLATPWGPGSTKGITQFIDTYDPTDYRLSDTWLSGPQNASDGTPLTGSYDLVGQPLIFTKELPDGIYTGEGEGYRMNKFEVKMGNKAHLNVDFPFFRYAQVLFMKAECLLRTGKSNEAATIVSEIRERAFKENPSNAFVSASDLEGDSRYDYGYVEEYQIVDEGNTDLIQYGGFLDELGWEFAWEAHRRRDMIRFGVFTTKSWLSHKPNGDHRIVFPIPQIAINSNPKIEQNPNY